MTEEPPAPRSVVIPDDQPVICVPDEIDGRPVTRYYFSEEDAGVARTDADLEAARRAIGAWADLDWPEMIDALDRIRHESEPTPPIDEP